MSLVDTFRAFVTLFIAPIIGAFTAFLMAFHRFCYVIARDWYGWNKSVLLKDQVIVITGGAGGFGVATTKLLVENGAIVYALDMIEPDEAAEKLPKTDRCIYKKIDITDFKALEKFANELRKKNVQVYALLNNAGISGKPTAAAQSPAELTQKVFDVNLFAAVELTRLLFDVSNPLFKFNSNFCVGGRAPIRSRVVNLTSAAGLVTTNGACNYCATKFALEAYTDVTRLELRDKFMDVVLVEPYFAATGIYRSILDEKNTYDGSILQEKQLKAREKFSRALSNNVMMSAEFVAGYIFRALTEAVPQDRYFVAPPAVEAQIRSVIHWPNYFHLVDKLKNQGTNRENL
jgi:NAD(P)-dependent dehydrogenase (short-subunit alcohol dehydrogenase family)